MPQCQVIDGRNDFGTISIIKRRHASLVHTAVLETDSETLCWSQRRCQAKNKVKTPRPYIVMHVCITKHRLVDLILLCARRRPHFNDVCADIC